nr:unnamed protein product [Naegleria fowleri]
MTKKNNSYNRTRMSNDQPFFEKAPTSAWRRGATNSNSKKRSIYGNGKTVDQIVGIANESKASSFSSSKNRPVSKDSLLQLLAIQDPKQPVMVKGVITEIYPEAFAYALSDPTTTIRVEILPEEGHEESSWVDVAENRLKDSLKILHHPKSVYENDQALMDANTNMEDPSRLIEGCGLLIYLKSIASFILIKGYPHHVATLYYASRFAQLREDILEEQTRLLPKHLLIEMKKKITKKWKNSVMDKWMRDQAECSLTTFTRERPSERILFSVACTSPVFSHQTLSETIMDRKERYSPLREFLNNHLKELEEENGSALGYASEELIYDREVLLTAVRQDGNNTLRSFLYHRPNLWDYPTTKPFTQYDYELFSDKPFILEKIKAGCQEVFNYAPRDIIEDR